MQRLCLLISLVITATVAKNSYVVISPATIRPGTELSLSVNILSSTRPVNVKASILQASKELANGSGVFTAGTLGTLKVQIPSSLASSTYTLTVEGSGGLTFSESKTVSVNKKQISLFIQTDKATYKPGDKVNFRTFAIYSDLRLYSSDVDISIVDAESNKIKQWLKVKPINGVITKEFLLSSQPVLGDWKIKVTTPIASQSKTVKVAEYVLPKFKVEVSMPPFAVTTDSDITFTVKATYTYGKPVKGDLEVSADLLYAYQLIRPRSSSSTPVFTTRTLINGETQVTIPMSKLSSVTSRLNGRKVSVVANVTESLTGNTRSGEGSVTIYDTAFKLEFPKSNPSTFKPALKYEAYLKVSQQDGLPVAASSHPVSIDVTVYQTNDLVPHPLRSFIYDYYPRETSTTLPTFELSVPANGLVIVPVDMPGRASRATIQATYRDQTQRLRLGKSHSPSNSYIQLSLTSNTRVQAGDYIGFDVKGTQVFEKLIYQVFARGVTVTAGYIRVDSKKTVSFSMLSTASMAPNARIVVYYVRGDGEIVTDSISFDVSGAFKNKVSVSLNQTDAEPGDTVEVKVTADPGSQAHLLAIDQSVLLLESGNDVSVDDVYSELKAYGDITPPPPGHFPILPRPILPRPIFRRKRMALRPYYPTYSGGSDATKIFQKAGVIVITDALVFQHIDYAPRPMRMRFAFGGLGGAAPEGRMGMFAARAPVMAQGPMLNDLGPALQSKESKPLAEVERVRSNFAETWLWTSESVGADGKVSITTAVPDTITSWVTSAFATHPQSGLGVAEQKAYLQVFRPFFVSLNLPYSVTRGEQVVLQAIVFNYMPVDMTVRVTLLPSKGFHIILDYSGREDLTQTEAVQEIVVAAGEAKNVYFPIVPADLGKLDIEVKAQSTQAADAVRRQLLVEAEGVPKEYNIPVLIDLTGGQSTFQEVVDISLPLTTVDGSELVRISAVGDLMGPSIAGLEKLLRMPTGCGEQNMLGLAPDVYITDYLKTVNQLSGEIKKKALRFMEAGYQRELTYKHADHSFSAFGKSDDSGSMWLTAFVARVFHQAKSHIFVDDDVIIRAIQWIISKQNKNGSFPEPGRVIHKNMQGQAASGPGLSLFVFISLLENRELFLTGPEAATFRTAQEKALAYLEMEVLKSDDTYLLALASYAFQLAGSTQTQAVLDKLEAKAIHTEGLTYWHQPETPKATTGSWHSPNPTKAIDTEITSYVLLTRAIRKDIIEGVNIMQWVVKQRNPNGGFSSTQDTVVALNALSEFAKLIYVDNFNIHIDAELNATTTYSFDINQYNALVMQSRETNTVPSQVKIQATGSGMALVEVAVSFNVEEDVDEKSFYLKVKILEDTINRMKVESCSSWLGDGPASGMAVQEIGIPSGFDVDPGSISKHLLLKRTEFLNKKVVLYFDEIGTAPVCLTFVAERTGLVAKSQPAAVRIYDYYEPGNQVTVFFQSETLRNTKVCEICPDCGNCVR